MTNIVPLSNEVHAKYKVVERNTSSRFKNQHLVPVVAQDFYTMPAEFPLVFVKHAETGGFIAVALMGFNKGHNLYCQTDEWTAPVRPIAFTNAPFSVAFVDDDSDQLVVLIDETSPLVSETEGEPLYDANGEKSEYLTKRIDAVVKIAEQTAQTQAFCRYLDSKNLLISKQLKIQQSQDTPQYVIDGIYTVDEEALKNLPLEELDQIRQGGLLGLIYAHLTSLGQLNRISQKQFEADRAASA